MAKEVYVRKHETALVSIDNKFIYEVSVFCRYKNYFSLINNRLYSSNVPILDFIPNYMRDAHTEICCELLFAPLPWLLENDFIKYVKPDKKESINKTKTTKNVKSKTTIGKSRSWSPNG